MTRTKRNWTSIPKSSRFKLNMRVTVWENTHSTLRHGTIYHVGPKGCDVIFDGSDRFVFVVNCAMTPEGGWASA